jgi:hypothetical protein
LLTARCGNVENTKSTEGTVVHEVAKARRHMEKGELALVFVSPGLRC